MVLCRLEIGNTRVTHEYLMSAGHAPESESLQGREEPLGNGYDTYNEVTDPVAIEGTEFIKYEDHEIKNEAQVDLVQLKEEPLDVINSDTEKDPLAVEKTDLIKSENLKVENEGATVDKGTVKGITKNCITYKRSVNNSVYDGIIKEKFSECTCAYSDVTIETLVENTSSENKLPVQKEKKLVCEYCNKRFTCNCLKRHISFHANVKKKLSKVCYS
ncbi:uncharacterized protein LOC142317464 [Lycorma delicatula]|uniref:uncharacterized protein LOC142317464 n=1 Tax=Lycorma delicatula TaxID=130591 RepID=UPI003F514C44